MKFNEKELDYILNKNVDRIIFESNGQKVMMVDFQKLISKRITTDPNLRKQLLVQALQSED